MNMKDRIYLTTYHFFKWLVTHTPEKILFPILKAIARFAWLVDRRHRRVARVNLDLAFGDEMSDEEKERIVKKTYENLVFNLADFIAHQDDSPEEILRRVTVENRHYVEDLSKQKKPVIFLTAHYGNWEMLPRVYAALFGPISIVGRPLDSKPMDELLKSSREKQGVTLIEKKGAMKEMIKALKNGRSVGLLVDHNTTRAEGVPIDFFGKKATQTPAAAILARRFEVPIIPIFITSDDHKHFKVRLYPPLVMQKSADKDEDIRKSVQAQADIIERVIREKPDEWFWLHKRWRAYHKELYERSGAA